VIADIAAVLGRLPERWWRARDQEQIDIRRRGEPKDDVETTEEVGLRGTRENCTRNVWLRGVEKPL